MKARMRRLVAFSERLQAEMILADKAHGRLRELNDDLYQLLADWETEDAQKERHRKLYKP